MERYDAARGTVRQALAVLRTEGLIEVHHGKGAFVRDRPPIRLLAHDRFARRHRQEGRGAFLAEMKRERLQGSVEVEYVGPDRMPGEIATMLDVDPDTEVLVRRRRYFDDGQPVEIATSYLPMEIAAGTPIAEEDTGPGGIYARLEDLGHRLGSFTEEVSARMPHPEEARSLDLPTGVPVMRVVRQALDIDGRVLEVCDTIKAADRYCSPTRSLPTRADRAAHHRIDISTQGPRRPISREASSQPDWSTRVDGRTYRDPGDIAIP